eukprot:TRINITY_DN11260_c0_g1_i1.p1 TRINITY_DN11260_c0_g1~~TRINITY_DN11260_c0_g1_i1.p1  ORF type:complete len:259 (+),score=108.66 TRINITY_DN11260_c0_g1_i1:73-849(+)
MCTTSAAMADMGAPAPALGRGPQGARVISPISVKASLGSCHLLDCREKEEFTPDAVPALEGAQLVDNAMLFLKACKEGKHNNLKQSIRAAGKKLVCYCNSGYRSAIVSSALEAMGFDAYSMEMGLKGWNNYATLSPEVVVTLTTTDVEKATLAFSCANAALAQGKVTAVVCFAHGVDLMKRVDGGGAVYDDMKANEPFKPMKVLVDNFNKDGGVVFCCNTCVKSRGLEFKDLQDFVHFMQAPDFVRMNGAAKQTMPFA